MKYLFITLIFIIGSISFTSAQKYAFIDVEYILSKMPEYTEAQKKLDDLAEKYQTEIKAAYTEIDKKINALKQEEILLPAETKKQREMEIGQMQQEAQQLQQQRFGVKGDIFNKRKELIEPIQNKIYKAVKDMSADKGYDFVLDKGANSNILFVDVKYDKSDYVLTLLKK
jgi:outer membrane protein